MPGPRCPAEGAANMVQNSTSKRTKTRGTLAVVLAMLIAAVAGCDQIEAKPVANLAEPVEEVDERALSIDPDVESVGPDDAMRVYYQFVDSSGRVQFVERITDVPEAWRAQVGFVEMNQPPPLTPQAARRSWQVSSTRTAQILAENSAANPTNGASPHRKQQREDVILYYATWCGYCKQAKAHLDREGVEYDLRNIDNGAIKSELKEKTGRTGIPVLDFSGEILRGYSKGQYEKVIRTLRS